MTPVREATKETRGAFHLSELTGQTIPVVMRISLLIKTLNLAGNRYACADASTSPRSGGGGCCGA